MSWWKKLSDTNERLYNTQLNMYNFKKTKKEKTLEEWRNETKNIYLKICGSEVNESPYITYFFKYCQYCDEFLPESCFNRQSIINVKAMLLCSKLRLNIKLLQDESKCNYNK